VGEPSDVDDLIANARDYYPALDKLLGEYFDDDWEQAHRSWESAVDAFVADAAPAERAEAARELDKLLADVTDGLVLDRVLWPGFWCHFIPSAAGLGSVEWLRLVRDLLPSPVDTSGRLVS